MWGSEAMSSRSVFFSSPDIPYDSRQHSVYLRPTGEPGLFGVIMALSGLGLDHDAVMKDRTAFQDALTTITGRKDLKVVELVWVAQWS